LTYSEFPSKFVWFAKEKEWKPRKKGYNIGRLTYIPPALKTFIIWGYYWPFKKVVLIMTA